MATWLPTLHREDDGWNLQFPAVRRAIRQLESVGAHVSTKPLRLHLPFGYRWQLPIEEIHAVNAQYCEGVSDADVECISAFSKIDCLALRGTLVRGDVLHCVRQPRRIYMLDLGQSQFDDEHAENLLRFEHLQCLFLDRTRITDAAIDTILRLPWLDDLWINHCPIGVESIRRLAAHPRLSILHASPNQISAAEALRLQRESIDRFHVHVGDG